MKKFITKFKSKFFLNNPRGFNLFSSVVAAVLVMSAVVLVNTLISTEEKTTNQVYLMVNSFELSDAASLARADALQSFNYFFRERMETWLTCRYEGCRKTISTGEQYDDGFSILNMDNYDNFSDLVDTFEDVVLYNDPTKPSEQQFDSVIQFIANQTVDRFNTTPYGRYTVSLSDTSENAKIALRTAMSQALKKSNEQNKKFVEVIQCGDNYGSCPIGTFYFNINLKDIDQATYEKLPRIIIRDTLSGEEMKTAILPRSNLKIYIPLRFFKVIYEAREQARAIDSISSKLEYAELGFCDSVCAPRTDPTESQNSTTWDKECPVASGLNVQTLVGASLLKVSNYDPGGSQGATNGLNSFTRSEICTASAGLGEIDDGAGFINYNLKNGGLKPSPGEVAVSNCPYESIFITPESYATMNVEGSAQKLYCLGMRGTESSIIYEETNPEFIVSGKKLLYKIKITSNYISKASSNINGTCLNDYANKKCILK